MQYKAGFSSYHPIINLLFFISVMTFPMLFAHPTYLLISLICSSLYYAFLVGEKARSFLPKTVFGVIFITLIMNCVFSHEGQTILFYLPSENPLTLESLIYGFFTGMMISSVFIWFMCMSVVMTTEKFIYIFSKVSPSLSLLLSMTLKFTAKFKNRFNEQIEIQRVFYGEGTSRLKKAKTAVACFVSVISWSFESAVDTADSMKSRGYGTKKRTAYSDCVFFGRDKAVLTFILFCAVFIVCGGASGALKIKYYPSFTVKFSIMTFMLDIGYFALCILPVYIGEREARQWKSSKPKI